MKKFLIAAAGLSAVAAAAPAAAQYYPAPPPPAYGYGYAQPGYNQPYGQAYGYNYRDQQGLVRSYLVRADQLRRQVERRDIRNRIGDREARRLRDATIDLQNRTRSYARDGLSNRERYDLDQRFARIEQALRYASNNRGWNQYRDRDRDGVWDRNDPRIDRDRDGRDDRYEDDRGRYPG